MIAVVGKVLIDTVACIETGHPALYIVLLFASVGAVGKICNHPVVGLFGGEGGLGGEAVGITRLRTGLFAGGSEAFDGGIHDLVGLGICIVLVSTGQGNCTAVLNLG